MMVPHEVPAGPKVFVNRQPDFEWMAGFRSAGGSGMARVGVCTGLPGVGKTAFVRRCVDQLRDERVFADGDLYVDFGSVQDEPVSVADALSACLTALGVTPEAMPSTLAGRANRLRSLTAHKAVLIVLDDVTDPAQVLPFVPNGGGSAVLVTSNSRLSELVIDGADPHRLAPLDGAAGAHMLTELVGARAGAEPGPVAELVRLCAGLPVALKIAAARLIGRPGLPIADLVAEITSATAPFAFAGRDPVSAVFSAACVGLEDDAARLYRLLGWYPGRDLTVDTAAVLLGRDSARTAAAVGSLIEAGLLGEDSGRRLSLHPLLRRHAALLAEKQDPDRERADALRAVTRHLVIRAAFADLAILGPRRYRCTPQSVTAGYRSPFPEDTARRDALAWLEAERMNLLAVQRGAATAGWHEWAWQLAEALTALYLTRRYYVDWTVSSEIGADSARLAGDRRAEARLRSFMSRAWIEIGKPDRAHEELIVKALPLAEATGDGRLLASVWEFIGRYRDATDPGQARAAYDRSIALFEQQNDVRGRAFVTFFMAKTLVREGDLASAETVMRTALALIRDVGDPRMTGRALTELGRIVDARGRGGEARELVIEAAGVLAASGDAYYEAEAQECLLNFAEQDYDVIARRSALMTLVRLHRGLGSDRADEFTMLLGLLPEQI